MAVDWSVHYDAIYAALGVAATIIAPSSAGQIEVTAIDKTAGVTVADEIEVHSVKPAATVRMAELIANNFDKVDLDGGSITLNGKTWRIRNHLPRPSPAGEDVGELYLFLSAA